MVSPFLTAVALDLSEPRHCVDRASADGDLMPVRLRFGVVGPNAIAGIMVLSEVAQRLMMMSGADASTSAAGYGRAATSRMNEVATTTVPAGHR
ncbi:hypothetical protein BKD09_15525 [Bradyrhizobium japonicum]|uniref:Uncharacterized protein n=1 Tax=Bradyrhizobium japonicum TaxID=375 RepID=A0A1L3F8Y2_BRAJP|nr:hypothetical protein BKD09_15525 [Bradyrhizobium japonicum]